MRTCRSIQAAITLATLAVLSGVAHASQWLNTFDNARAGDYLLIRSVAPATDNGFLVAGSALSGFWTAKVDAQGRPLSQTLYQGAIPQYAYAMAATSDGGYVIAGSANLSNGATLVDAVVLRLDSTGNVLWQKSYGGSGEDVAWAIRPTPDGGYIVAGWTNSYGAGNLDGWLLKLDSSGNITWQKSYGGAQRDSFGSVDITADGGYIVAGNSESFGLSGYAAWVIKLDAQGQIIWQEVYPGAAAFESANSVRATTDGGYVLAGQTRSFGVGMDDIWVLKLNGSGNVLWQRSYGGAGQDVATSVQPTADGGYVVTGFTNGATAVILKLDAAGNATWEKAYTPRGATWGYAVLPTVDGYVIAGEGRDTYWVGWLAKIGADGALPGCGTWTALALIATNTSAVAQATAARITVTNSASTSGPVTIFEGIGTSQQSCYFAAPPQNVEVPALSTWVIITLAGLLGLLGALWAKSTDASS